MVSPCQIAMWLDGFHLHDSECTVNSNKVNVLTAKLNE